MALVGALQLVGVLWKSGLERYRKRHIVCLSMDTASAQAAVRSEQLPASALAIASAIRTAADGPLNFTSRREQGLVIRPSLEMVALCGDQLGAYERDFEDKLRLTLYVRTPECYGTAALELRHVSWHAKGEAPLNRELILLFKYDTEISTQQAERYLAKHGAMELPEFKALVVPIVKELCLIGVIVAERMTAADSGTVLEQAFTDDETAELVKVARSLALICLMDQRLAILQQASWKRTMQIDDLLEQGRRSVAAIRTLGKMLQPHLHRGEISGDVLEDILVQGNRTNDVLQQIRELLYMGWQGDGAAAGMEWTLPDKVLDASSDRAPVASISIEGDAKGVLSLAPGGQVQPSSCNVAEVLNQLIKGGTAMAIHMKIELNLRVDPSAATLAVAMDESALRQAMSKLVDSAMLRSSPGGWVHLAVSQTPGGDVLVLIEDNGPDTAPQALVPLATPDAAGLVSLKLARDILEDYGATLRVTSPHLDRRGGLRVQVWLPACP